MFEILSIGDSKYLADILNSLAMITATDSFLAMCKIAVMVGVIGVVFSSLMNAGKSIDYHHILVAYIIWACMFVPKVSVQVEDKYTNVVYKIDNVPIGPAAAGTLVSAIGSSLTDLFEVSYSPIVPGMSTTSFLESLQLLSNARESTGASMFYVALDQDAQNGLAVKPSVVEYIKNCTLKKIDVGITDFDHMRAQSYEDAIKFDTPVFQTTVFTTTGGAATMGCDVAWNNHLSKDIKIDAATIAQMGALLGLNSSNLKVGETAKDKLDSALNALTGSSISADAYMKTVLYESLYAEATQVRLHEGLHSASSVAVNQAIQQRNSDWAGGHSLFMTTVRPMIAFFEAFIYAITPVMAFTILLGALGIKLASKYFMLILWVQLWYPLLSIINLYIYTASQREISTNGSIASYNWDSFYSVATNDVIAQSWISTGGLLATATPAIALFLVTGSAVAFTSLSSKLAGSDYFNEKQTAPDISSSKPVLEMSSMHQGNKATGQVQGVGGMLEHTAISASDTQSKYSAISETASATSGKAMSSTIANTKSSAVTEASNIAATKAIRDGVAASGSQEQSAAWGRVEELMKGANLDASEQSAITNSFAETADVNGSVDVGQLIQNIGVKGAGKGALAKIGKSLGNDQKSASRVAQIADAKAKHAASGSSEAFVPPPVDPTGATDGAFGLTAALRVSGSNQDTDTSKVGSTATTGSGNRTSFTIGSAGRAAMMKSYASELANSETLTTAATRGDQDAKTVQAAASSSIQFQQARSDAEGINHSMGSAQSFDPIKFSAPGGQSQPYFNQANLNMRESGYGDKIDSLAEQYSNDPRYGQVSAETAQNMAVAQLLTHPESLPGIQNNPALLQSNASTLKSIFNAHNGGVGGASLGPRLNGSESALTSPAPNIKSEAMAAGRAPEAEGAALQSPKQDHLSGPPNVHEEAAVQQRFEAYKGDVNSAAKGYDNDLHSADAKRDGASILSQAAGKVPATPPVLGGALDAIKGEGPSRVAAAMRAGDAQDKFWHAMTTSDPKELAAFREEVTSANAGRIESLSGGPDGSIAAKGGAHVIDAAASLGEYMIGGVENAKAMFNQSSDGSGNVDWQKFAENAKNIPTKELGQMSAYGTMMALNDGADAFVNFQANMHSSMTDLGRSYGLTEAQANVFADGFTGSNTSHKDALRAEIQSTHTDKGEADEVYKNMEHILSGASNASTMPQAYLANVVNYNNHAGLK
ncbi:MAG: conjugal transfer protein TraG [Gammaproteobacteria bacterium]|nr:MAG: conjugal transfer protein TraG [Gammaproteobacteria bacterium]